MASIPVAKGKTLYTYGSPMTSIHLIVKGKVTVSYPGGHYTLSTGDVIGISEICSEIHFLEYTVLEDAELATYAVHSMEALEEFLLAHTDIARLCLISSFKQIATLLNQSSINSIACSDLYTSAKEDFQQYLEICERQGLSSIDTEAYDNLEAYLGDEAPDYWLNSFYTGLCKIYSSNQYTNFIADASVSMGMLRKCSLDLRRTYIGLEEQSRYAKKVCNFYVNESGQDFVQSLLTLYGCISATDSDSDTIFHLSNRLFLQLEDFVPNKELLKKRQDSFYEHIAAVDTQAIAVAAAQDKKEPEVEIRPELADSMSKILAYSGADEEYTSHFRILLNRYLALGDKYSMDEETSALRARLTQDFYTLYDAIFWKALNDSDIPVPVKMFLYYGYIDENLAGYENAAVLEALLPQMEKTSGTRVYPFFHWLKAIYRGEKEPSRNEFDTDYNDMIRKQKVEKNLSLNDFRMLESDQKAKVNYELQNMFPATNKMTFGRISAFLPFFTKENVLKDLNNSLITPAKTDNAITDIKAMDYTVFFREYLDSETASITGKLGIHKEFLPDVILMPNSGVRAVMWQEIEGKLRTSSARFVISAFHQEDIPTSFIRLAAEFRWEMCKRIQGGRWNDVSDASLTSEYFDYIQFYRKNHDLSSEAKEKVRTSLQRCKNSFKEMFVRDYIIWILYEGKGSIRLNKVARKILFTYCPFPSEIIVNLAQNPQYTELLHRHKIKYAQHIHLLDNIAKKIVNSGHMVPDILKDEISYYQRGNLD